jgi:RNA polymerase sigma factor (sigma-70 family)
MLEAGRQSVYMPVDCSFNTTHWSVVLAASAEACDAASVALEQLCRAYWKPVFVYARRCGWDHYSAEDLTQEFFQRVLERRYLAQADPQKGRFRNFLLVAFKHFLANEWDRVKAVKRGGRINFISIDHEDFWEPCTTGTPDQAFARAWALVFVDRVIARLRGDLERDEQRDQFDRLKHWLTPDESNEPYAELAKQMGTTEGAVKMAVQRLRKRFATALREEVARTIMKPEEIEDEIRCLFAAVSG